MIKPPFLKDWAMPNLITLTTNGSVLPVPGNSNHVFVSRSYHNYFSALPLFQKVCMTALL